MYNSEYVMLPIPMEANPFIEIFEYTFATVKNKETNWSNNTWTLSKTPIAVNKNLITQVKKTVIMDIARPYYQQSNGTWLTNCTTDPEILKEHNVYLIEFLKHSGIAYKYCQFLGE